MIEKLSIRNYKSLRSVDLDLTPIHAFIGPNDSGKTSILEAVYALCRTADYPLAQAFVGPWEGRDLVSWNSNESEIDFQIRGKDMDIPFSYRLSCKFPDRDRAVLVNREEVEFPKSKSGLTSMKSSGKDRTRVYSLFHEDDSGFGELGNMVPFVGHIFSSQPDTSVQFCRFVPKMLALPCAIPRERRYSIDPSGFGLPTCLYALSETSDKEFRKLKDRLTEIFPDIEDLFFRNESGFKAQVDPGMEFPKLEEAPGIGLYFQFKGHSEETPAFLVSDGMLLVLAFLTLLYLPDRVGPRVLLVDEPEKEIHYRLLELLVVDLLSTQPHHYSRQVLMTTHSPYLLDHLERDQVTLCVKGEDRSTKVRPLRDIVRFEREGDIFELGEIWSSDTDENLFNDIEEKAQIK